MRDPTQRENRHCSPSNTVLFPPANMDSSGVAGKGAGIVPYKNRGNMPAAFVSALKLWYPLFCSEQVACFPKGWLSLQSRFQTVPESAQSKSPEALLAQASS